MGDSVGDRVGNRVGVFVGTVDGFEVGDVVVAVRLGVLVSGIPVEGCELRRLTVGAGDRNTPVGLDDGGTVGGEDTRGRGFSVVGREVGS